MVRRVLRTLQDSIVQPATSLIATSASIVKPAVAAKFPQHQKMRCVRTRTTSFDTMDYPPSPVPQGRRCSAGLYLSMSEVAQVSEYLDPWHRSPPHIRVAPPATPVSVPDFGGSDIEGIEAAFGE